MMGGFYIQYLDGMLVLFTRIATGIKSYLRRACRRLPVAGYLGHHFNMKSQRSAIPRRRLTGMYNASMPRRQFRVWRRWCLPLGTPAFPFCRVCGLLTNANPVYRAMPTSWMEGPHVRGLPQQFRLHLSRARQWTRVPYRPSVRIGSAGAGERCHACIHGVPQLLCQWRDAGQERGRPGAAGH